MTLRVALIAALALSWVPRTYSLPSCCKAHHCTMKKHCGIGTPSPAAAAKIYTVLCNVSAVALDEMSFDFPTIAPQRAPLAPAATIDHPPRLLLV